MTSAVSPFIQKLQQILNDPINSDIINFNESSARLQISNKKKLENILPKYFRHGKFESFVRQLNWYGFYKINNKTINCYSHPDLQKGKKLSSIKSRRKNMAQRTPVDKIQQVPHVQIQALPQPIQAQNNCLAFYVPSQNHTVYNGLQSGNHCFLFDTNQLQIMSKFHNVCPFFYTF